jgi:predicted branched-subunit amino acid permease
MSTRRKSNQNFFIKFWNGDLSLPMSYWLVGIVFGIIVGFTIGLFVGFSDMPEFAIDVLLIPWFIFIFVGIWRSSDKYKGAKFWAILAKVAVVLGVFSALSQLLLSTS